MKTAATIDASSAIDSFQDDRKVNGPAAAATRFERRSTSTPPRARRTAIRSRETASPNNHEAARNAIVDPTKPVQTIQRHVCRNFWSRSARHPTAATIAPAMAIDVTTATAGMPGVMPETEPPPQIHEQRHRVDPAYHFAKMRPLGQKNQPGDDRCRRYRRQLAASPARVAPPDKPKARDDREERDHREVYVETDG